MWHWWTTDNDLRKRLEKRQSYNVCSAPRISDEIRIVRWLVYFGQFFSVVAVDARVLLALIVLVMLSVKKICILPHLGSILTSFTLTSKSFVSHYEAHRSV